MRFLLAILTILAAIPIPLRAHPVSYKGALSVMSWNQPFLNDLMTTYSFHRKAAVAARYMRMDMEDGEMQFYAPTLNVLAKRWNGAKYQSNIYVSGGWGGYELGDRQGSAGFGSLEADYETRRVYTSAQVWSTAPSFGESVTHSTLRLGRAAYAAEYNQLASWFIVELQHNSSLAHTWTITPLLRFYYLNMLAEMGSSLDGDFMLNMMVHF
jgi:hypothetical protein